MLDTRDGVESAERACRIFTGGLADSDTVPDAQSIPDAAADTHPIRLVHDDGQLLDHPRSGARSR